jgi:RNA polymerase sigma factor (sigma-70 family)
MVKRAVAELPERQRAVFILRHYQDLSLKEIARVQGCSLGAVKANLFQALKKLRNSLQDYYSLEVER